MTPDERLEKLLNRAGQTISDLPSPIDYNIEQEELAMEAAADFGSGLETYILHLTDVIDRMETALENVCGERDYLCDRSGCEFCAYERIDGDKMPCRGCTVTKNLYEFAGVPEDWSADDD